MAFKNYMEDVVTDVVDIILQEKEINISDLGRRDIIAFSLNRLPPKYIVSERGFTHSIIDEKNNPEFKDNIVTVVNKAIEVVLTRPRGFQGAADPTIGPVEHDGNDYFNFPHFLGELSDRTDLNYIEDVDITLYLNDKICEMHEPTWINPYVSKKVTGKFYSFWPKAVLKNQNDDEQQTFTFRIRFEHKKYYSFEREIILLIEAENIKYNYIRRNYTELIEMTALEPRDH